MLFQNTYQAAEEAGSGTSFCKTNNKSLQAQAAVVLSRKKKRASCFAPSGKEAWGKPGVGCLSHLHGPDRGSATVEAALILPIFLCGLSFFILTGQLLLVEGEIQHAVSKTAMTCAGQESLRELSGSGTGLSGSANAAAAFYTFLQSKDLCQGCIKGGKRGIMVSMKKSSEEGYVTVTADYILRIPVPFLGGHQLVRKLKAKRRMYTGFVLHKGEGGYGEGPLVYVTEHGSVYHTSLSCTHISLRISGSSRTIKMLEARGIRACEKCIRKGNIPHELYITAEGDCYHSSLGCSGLKRTVRTVNRNDIGGLQECSRCAAKRRK